MSHLAGVQVPAGTGVSTILPDMDFETYSEAGYNWDIQRGKWKKLPGATSYGLPAVGAAAYAAHPSTQILSLAYDLKDGRGPRLWLPGAGMDDPVDLFAHVVGLGIIEAWNCGFEYWIWHHVCRGRWGWPPLQFWQLRDAPAKAQAFGLPRALGLAAAVTGAAVQKNAGGKRLLKKFSMPRNPSMLNPGTRTRPLDDPADATLLYMYNIDDICSESAVSMICPDLPPDEQNFELATRAMNIRGVAVDMATVNAAAHILDEALIRYNQELQALTGGFVETAAQKSKLKSWLELIHGITTDSLDADARDRLLAEDLTPTVRRVLDVTSLISSASVKKIYAIQRQAVDGRLHDLFQYHRARTGRDGGADVQPQNLPKKGPVVRWCENATCGRPYARALEHCPHCGTDAAFSRDDGWSFHAVDTAIDTLRTGSLDETERVFGDALATIAGCIRGLFIAAPGHDLICSDYSAIEAVVTAVVAGEQWRIDAFRRHEDIYLVSAGRITGRTLAEYTAYVDSHGEKHPDRQRIGKPAELGLGFGGWVSAWHQFDDSGTFTDDEIKQNILAWRAASPAIVELWGGQVRGKPWDPDYTELYGLEGAAIAAIQNPGQCYAYRSISYGVRDDVLYCRLPSGRNLAYHRPRLSPSDRWEGQLSISFEGYNSNPKTGPIGWIRMHTYGGRLTENVVQGIARDFMRDAVLRLEPAGYPIVLRVHDELVAEVPENWGSIPEFERIMSECPTWAPDWPIRASGGWRAKRYRKD